MIRYMIALALLTINPLSWARQASYEYELDTRNNAYNIKEGETCLAIHLGKSITITCPKSGKSFEGVTTIAGSPTGTPPWLEYKNYIGYRIAEEPTERMVGSGRRIMYFKGLPQKK